MFGGFAKTDTEPWAKDPDDEKLDRIRKTELEVGGVWAKDPDDDNLDEVKKMELDIEVVHSSHGKSYTNKGLESDEVIDAKV